MVSNPSADQHCTCLQTKMTQEPSPSWQSRRGKGSIIKILRSHIVFSLTRWPNAGRPMVSLSHLGSKDHGFPTQTDMKEPRSWALRILNREKTVSLLRVVSVNSSFSCHQPDTIESPFSGGAN